MDRRSVLGAGLAATLVKPALADTVMPGDGVLPSDPKENIILWPGTPPGGRSTRLPPIRVTNHEPPYLTPSDRAIDQVGVPVLNVQRAMRLVRANAATWGVDPARIGFMGFSAGGHVACSIATRFAAKVYDPVDAADSVDARPSFSMPIYPVVTMGDGR